jgi:hypothetical protein
MNTVLCQVNISFEDADTDMMLFKINLLVRYYKRKLVGTRPKAGDIIRDGLSVWCTLHFVL